MDGDLLQRIILLSVAFASFSILVTGVAVYRSNRSSVTHRSLLILAFSAVGWSLFNYLTFYGAEESFGIWALRLQVFFAVAYSFSLFRLFYFFPNAKFEPSWKYKYLAIPAAIIAGLLTLTPLVFSEVTSYSETGGIEDVVNGPAIPVFGMIAIALIVSGIAIFTRKFVKASNQEKPPLKYVLTGTIITFTFHIVFNLILPAVFNIKVFAPFGAVYILPFVGFFTWAIVQHQFFNVKLIATQAFVGLIALILLGRIITAKTYLDVVIESIILLAVIVVGFFLVRSVKGEVERREEIEQLARQRTETLNELEQRNKSLAALQRISDIVLNELDMKLMAQKILDEIPKQLDNCGGCLVSIVRGGQLSAYSASGELYSNKVKSLIGNNLEVYEHPIKEDFNKIHSALVRKEQTEGENLEEFISPPVPRPIALTLQKLVGAKHMVAMPLYAGGEPLGVMMFVYKVQKEKLHDKDLEIAKAIADDMSLAIQRAQAFQKLKDANEYLSQLDKMKDEFISMASHELNTPLAAIEGYLSMILDEGMGKIDAQSREYLSRAYSSSKRLAELILDLLNVSRIEQGRLKMKYSKANLAEMAQSVIHELQIKADSKKIYLKLEADKSLPEIWCDPDRIREVIVNLTGNALKFTEKGGVVILISKSEGDFIRVSVKDTGRGIAKEDQKKLFQKFSQVKREVDEHQGTGLGLYISKNFVELHKGKLWVESDSGKGAVFSFELPIIKKPPVDVDGAILEKPISDAKIEIGKKPVPAIIAESSKK